MCKKFAISFFLLAIVGHGYAEETPEPKYFSQTEVRTLVDHALESVPLNENIKDKTADSITEKLKQYKVSGFSVGGDFNFAFFLDRQNPEFDFTFKNHQNDIKTRRYRLNFTSLGFRMQLAYNLNLIFLVNTLLDFYNGQSTIPLGMGVILDISSGVPGITVSYMGFEKVGGGALMVSIPIGATSPGISFITGGTLSPIEEYNPY
jgi:hypothetical protein